MTKNETQPCLAVKGYRHFHPCRHRRRYSDLYYQITEHTVVLTDSLEQSFNN